MLIALLDGGAQTTKAIHKDANTRLCHFATFKEENSLHVTFLYSKLGRQYLPRK